MTVLVEAYRLGISTGKPSERHGQKRVPVAEIIRPRAAMSNIVRLSNAMELTKAQTTIRMTANGITEEQRALKAV
jgi:hypothetical protein